ncbi:MAG TPA: AzlC family ABC transporter permease [Christensenellaceae bacterium]|nr:AzlC family ABC transporter permease [Christensenellaceae bacterium]
MRSFKEGIKTSLPVCIGMVSVGISFGLSARHAGLSVVQATLMSMIVVAGSSQFFAVEMIAKGASPLIIIVGTFFINLRHLVMSTYIMNRLKDESFIKKLILSYVICDESFTLFSLSKKQEDYASFLGGMNLMLYTSWSLGTLAGALLMNVVSSKFADALGIAIYAAFISMLMPSLKASRKILLTVVFTALVNVLLSTIMGNGLNIIISMLTGAFFATALPDERAVV